MTSRRFLKGYPKVNLKMGFLKVPKGILKGIPKGILRNIPHCISKGTPEEVPAPFPPSLLNTNLDDFSHDS